MTHHSTLPVPDEPDTEPSETDILLALIRIAPPTDEDS